MAAAATALALGAAAYLSLRGTAPTRRAAYRSMARPLTTYPGVEGHPSLSPDGSMVAFNWGGPNRGLPDIYIKLVGQGEPIRVTTDAAPDRAPAWSPDGDRLAFLRSRGGSMVSELFVVPALGGTERRVASVEAFGFDPDHPGTTYLSWTPDGKWVALGGIVDGLPGLWLIEVDGSQRRRLTEPSREQVDRSPVVSADGRRVAFTRRRPVSNGVLFVLALSSDLQPMGEPLPVVDPAPLSVIAAAWGHDDASLVFSTGSNMGTSHLQRVALQPDGLHAAGSAELLPFGEQATGLDIARSGRLVYASKFRDTGFLTLDLTHADQGLRHSQLVASTLDEHSPHLSPDGRRLVFVSTRSGNEEIWIANADGTHPRQMTSMGGPMCANPQWSPDGRQIAFSSSAHGSIDLYLLDPAKATTSRLTSAPGMEDHPRWSRDGRWIYFKGPGRATATDVWKMSATGGAAVRVTSSGGAVAVESHDGRVLFFSRVTDGRGSLWRMPVTGGDATPVANRMFGNLNFAVGRDTVYFVANTLVDDAPVGHSIDKIAITTGERTMLARFDRPAWWGVALSPDERTLIATAINASGTDLMVAQPVQ
jgi:Tol biopolymer transport system component